MELCGGIIALDVGRPLCTNRIRLRDGLRQLEMCIPFRGKKEGGNEEQTVSYQMGRLSFTNMDSLT